MPPSEPLVSIIIGNYNYERFVTQAVESALAQTYPAVEVVVVDDGSTDGSRALLEPYRDRVRLIFKSNGGATSTLEAGWAQATGEIIMFLDADDMLRPDAVAAIVAAWTPDRVKVQFPLTVIDAEARPLGFVPAATRPLDDARIRDLLRRHGIYPTPPTSGNAYARRFVAALFPLDRRRFPIGVDGALNAVAPLYGSVVSLGTSLGYYRVHGNNMWAGAPLDANRFGAYIAVGRDEARFLAEHAERQGFALDPVDPLDHSLVFLERRLALRKLAPTHPMAREDSALRLFLCACRCAGTNERGLVRAAVALAWFAMAAAAPRALALRVLAYRYVPGARPVLIERMARCIRRPENRPERPVSRATYPAKRRAG